MAHPYNSIRNDKVQKSRVSSIAAGCGGGFATGGGIAATKSQAISAVKATAQRLHGGAVAARGDRPNRARGGRLGKKSKNGHTVNVIVAPHSEKPATPAMIPGVAAAGSSPGPMPPRPPIAPPPMAPPAAGGPPPIGGPMPPPGMPMRKRGGAVFSGNLAPSKTARGEIGSNKADAMSAGIGAGRTPVQPSPNKQDGKNIGRKPVITKATGGPISSPERGGMGPKLGGGARGGKAKAEKASRLARTGYGAATVHASNPTRNP